MPSAPPLTAEQISRFHACGAIVLRGAIGADWLQALRHGVEEAMRTPGPYHHVQSNRDDPGSFFTEYYLTRRLAVFERFVRLSPLAGMAARLMASTTVRFFFDGLFVKEPGTRKRSQWHQDQPYYPIDGRQVAVLWLALDPIDKEHALEVVHGSHRWDRWFMPVLFRNGARLAETEPRYEPLPDVDGRREDYEILSWEMEPGDCVAFHGLSLHGARGNPTTARRRAVSTTWLGDDARFAPRAGELEPHFAHLAYEPGEPLTDETEFPLVWPLEPSREMV